MADDFSHQLGDKDEARLSAALTLRSTGACPAGSAKSAASGLEKTEQADVEQPYMPGRSPLRENRLIDPQPNPG